MRRTGQEFQYQLVIQRVYDEGEEELDDEAEDEDGLSQSLGGDKDEKVFLLDQSLHFRSEIRDDGDMVLAWRDLSGDAGDLYEFVCGQSISVDEFRTFEVVAAKCQYERKYRKSSEAATERDLEKFTFTEQPIPSASPTIPSASNGLAQNPLSRELTRQPSTSTEEQGPKMIAREKTKVKATPTVAPKAAVHPEGTEILTSEAAELHLFDFPTGAFIIQDPKVIATVSEVGKWQYWLQIKSEERDWLGQPVIADINPVFNFDYLSFIFNHYAEDGSAYSWLLRFKTREEEESFQEGLMRALWEQLNETKWLKNKDEERDYVLEAFEDLELKDKEADEEPEEEEEEEIEELERDGQQSEHYDSDEEDDDVVTRDEDGNVNSQLAVGYKHDRSFVVRGSKIGVFKHTPNNNLEFSTNISKVQTPGGKLFSPKKVMLHAEDKDMILQNGNDPHSLYRMDLEYGRIVDEWKVHDDIPVNTFAPEKVRARRAKHPCLPHMGHIAATIDHILSHAFAPSCVWNLS